MSEGNSLILCTQNGWNIIHHACAGGHLHVLKWLLKNVPTLNQCDVLNLVAKVSEETHVFVDYFIHMCVYFGAKYITFALSIRKSTQLSQSRAIGSL